MKNQPKNYYVGIEAGGTKFVCAIASDPENIVAETSFPTTNPEETMKNVHEFILTNSKGINIVSIGIASFGPVDLDLDSPTFGFITSTPKPGWAYTDIVGVLRNKFSLPVGFDTDVNGAALGEYKWGAGKGKNSLVYLTVGTGIGGGAISSGKIIHGLLHPEMGHIRIPHNWDQDPFPGLCPYHGDCLEGLSSGPAIKERWKMNAKELPDDHPGWNLEAKYLALALINYTFVLSPHRIILGGGVMNHAGLCKMIRSHFLQQMNNYINKPELSSEINEYIVPPGLGHRSGVLGAIALAQEI